MATSAQEPNYDASKAENENNDGNANHGINPGTTALNPPSSPTLKRASTTPTIQHLSAPSSAPVSPLPSREGSPTRPLLKSAVSTGPRTSRSRKNSQDLSPIRGPSVSGSSIPTVPSAAAIQRALSATRTPHLPPHVKQDSSIDLPQPQKPTKIPTSGPGHKIPRLSSPPPSASAGSNKSVLTTARKIDQPKSAPSTPSIVVDRPARSATSASESDVGEEEHLQMPGIRTPVRGSSGNGPALETVQESSLPSTPAIRLGRSAQAGKSQTNSERPERIEENPMEDAFGKEVKSKNESGDESAGKKSTGGKSMEEVKEKRKPAVAANSAKAATVQPKRSFSQLPFTKAPKANAEGSVKSMTVETETVSSIPQVALGGDMPERGTLKRTDTSGSLRLKPSNETIRPKKEKKKVVRKAPSLNAGNGGSMFGRYHHHHVFSRLPSSDSLISLLVSPPMVPDRMPEQRKVKDASLPGDHREKRTQNSCEIPPGAHRRNSSTVLIPFRGRTASTKADIFEAKIATAVDEANSSDSEETFVYESNPPEPHSARAHRFHSRTPSATSTASFYDNHAAKGRQDGQHSVVGKKSMKFANNYNSIGYANDEGTVRGPSHNRNQNNNTPHHHHIGRYGRGGHASLFDSDSPFPNATKSTQSTANNVGRFSPRNANPRSPHVLHVTKSPRKAEDIMSYDLEGEGADDERAPLIGSNRTARNRRRALPGSVRQMYSEEKGYSICGRVTAWTTLGSVLALLIAAIVAVVVLCSKPLINVHVKDIRNVLASEQEIMLDLHVYAINPNLVAIQVSELDINVFAKSKHVGTNELWRSHQPHDESPDPPSKSGRVRISSSDHSPVMSDPSDIVDQFDGIDEGTDPIDDPASDSQTMLLGQILEFDAPLIFDPSPLRHHSLSSLGEVRLAKPGNRTEEGGSQRWEHVIQHDFELIARGVMRYSLPVSSKLHSASIAGRVLVHPSEGPDENGNMKLSQPSWPFEPGSNVLLHPSKDAAGRSQEGENRQ